MYSASDLHAPTDNLVLLAPLADPMRRTIFESLLRRPLAVKNIAAELPISQPAVSQHLKVLKAAGLVREQRQGRFRLYVADPIALERLVQQASALRDMALSRFDETTSWGRRSGRDSVDQAMAQWARQWPEQDTLSVGILVRLRLISKVMDKLSNRSADRLGLTSMDLFILGTLERIGPPHESTLTELSRISFLSLPATSKHLDRAERRGLIRRRPDEQDARSNLIGLTDKGREMLHKVMEGQARHEFAAIYQMPEEKRLQVANILRTLLGELQSALDS